MADELLTRDAVARALSIWIMENRPRLFGKKWFAPEWAGIADSLAVRLEQSNIVMVRREGSHWFYGWSPGLNAGGLSPSSSEIPVRRASNEAPSKDE
jgi:hypothetical protein